MIILFGSYARGGWVEDVYGEDGVIYEYRSDFDILVVTEDKASAAGGMGAPSDAVGIDGSASKTGSYFSVSP
jgi:hypothetical protein